MEPDKHGYEIDLSGDVGRNWQNVCSLMLFPDPKDERHDQYVLLLKVDAAAAGKYQLTASDAKEISELNITFPQIRTVVDNAANRAMAAGAILQMIWEQEQVGILKPTFNTAIRRYMQFAEDQSLSGSESHFKTQCWAKYKQVAHLWAARLYMGDFAPSTNTPDDEFPATVRIFLETAKAFQEFFLSFQAASQPIRQTDKAIITPGELMKVPESVNALSLEFNGDAAETRRLFEAANEKKSKKSRSKPV